MADNQQFSFQWNNHTSTLMHAYNESLHSHKFCDCTLEAEGQYLDAHKVVLCVYSPFLEAIFSRHYEKHPIVVLQGVKFQELKSMVDLMYKGEVDISQDQKSRFLKLAELLQIKGLTDGGENNLSDVDSTLQNQHETPPVTRPAVRQYTGSTIEATQSLRSQHLSEPQPDKLIKSEEGSSSLTSRKRRRQQADEDGHQEHSCDLTMPARKKSITTVPTSIPALPADSTGICGIPAPVLIPKI